CRPQEMEMVHAGNVLAGNDADCTDWIMTYRDHAPSASGAPGTQATSAAAPASTSRRRGGRAARAAG
ncbi:MAG: methyltetrahydrofolate cobalamin methyltransferase, partial [Pseudomonadota bacterium]